LKKASLHDIKVNNRKLILERIIDKSAMSRIELARDTSLSPSTVTSLVSEMLDGGLLVETGEEVVTGGRRGKKLSINPSYGVIAIVQAGQKGATIGFFDMLLRKIDEQVISEKHTSGNSLFDAIRLTIGNFIETEIGNIKYLQGIGLLLQEDMRESEFAILYSTTLSSDVISLRDALFSLFRVPVLEEFSVAYSISEALNTYLTRTEAKNSAHISIANTLLASIMIDGKPLPMKNGESADFTTAIAGFDAVLPKKVESKSTTGHGLAERVAALIALLCAMFPLDVVLLSGDEAQSKSFLQKVHQTLSNILSLEPPPPIRALTATHDICADYMAEKIRNKILLTGTK